MTLPPTAEPERRTRASRPAARSPAAGPALAQATGLPRLRGRPARSAVPGRRRPTSPARVVRPHPAAGGPSGSVWRRRVPRRPRRRRTAPVARAGQETCPDRTVGHRDGRRPSRTATWRSCREPRPRPPSDDPAPRPAGRSQEAREGRGAPSTAPWGPHPSPSSGSTPRPQVGPGGNRTRRSTAGHAWATTTQPAPRDRLRHVPGRQDLCGSGRRAGAGRPSDENRSSARRSPAPHRRGTAATSPRVPSREGRARRSRPAPARARHAATVVATPRAAASRHPRVPELPSRPRGRSPEHVPARDGDAALLAAHSSW